MLSTLLKRLDNLLMCLVLADETATTMRLLGVERVEQLGPQHVSTETPFRCLSHTEHHHRSILAS
jgi:hypothetical protein